MRRLRICAAGHVSPKIRMRRGDLLCMEADEHGLTCYSPLWVGARVDVMAAAALFRMVTQYPVFRPSMGLEPTGRNHQR